jgi:hypothetical protein
LIWFCAVLTTGRLASSHRPFLLAVSPSRSILI